MKAWELRKDGLLLGILTATNREGFPWVECEFEPTREFQQYRPLFEEESRLTNANGNPDIQEQLKTYQQEMKELGLHLLQFGKDRELATFTLHIQGNHARLRVG